MSDESIDPRIIKEGGYQPVSTPPDPPGLKRGGAIPPGLVNPFTGKPIEGPAFGVEGASGDGAASRPDPSPSDT